MANKVKAIPEGAHTLTPYLCIKGADKAIEFYKKIFNAKEIYRMDAPGGRIGHAELEIGDLKLMLADEFPEWGNKSPQSTGGSPVTMHLYVENVDEVVKKAIAAGAKTKMEVQNQFYGDRSGSVIDPFGHEWHVSTHVEDVSEAEIRRRGEIMMSGKDWKKSAA